MLRRLVRPAVLLAALSLSATPALADGLAMPQPSPAASVMQTVGITPITVSYSSPGKKGRDVFGGLLPFGTLWRTGANGATTIEFGTDVTIAGTAVPAGKYALFTIPGKAEWTVILNKNPNQGGTRQYDEKLDLLRTKVKPTTIPVRERMAFVFADTTDEGTHLDLEWDTTRVRLPIQVATADHVAAATTGYQKTSSRALANAARYRAGAGDAKGALALLDASIAIEQTWFNSWLKADLLAKGGDYKAAYPLAETAYALGQKDDYFFWKGQVEKALKDWKSKR